MIIGIDVGGTHADGVLLQGTEVVAKNKVSVDHLNLRDSIITLLQSLLPANKNLLRRITLSTTLCTNAIVNDNLDAVGMFVQAGPGINPDFLRCGENIFFLSGAVDHRGQVVRSPVPQEVKAAVDRLHRQNVSSVGIVTKFSHRNNEHELWVRDQLNGAFPHLSMGHRISGMPHFPRRVYTTWLNSALKTQFERFQEAMEQGFRHLQIDCPCYILKADGGTFPFANACEFPCQSIHSGPSASVMGGLALQQGLGDAVLLDIGGTTTDICIFADGVPLLEPYGATVAERPTLIRALQTRSIGLGGDSSVSWQDDTFAIGPDKSGPPMALGGRVPTPTDAMIVLGRLTLGSQGRAADAMKILRPLRPVEETANELLLCFVAKIQQAVENMLEEVFRRPVYTVAALLQREKIIPQQLVAIGGPAVALQTYLADCFQLECAVPPDYEVANAIGAARARLTVQASLYCDTAALRLSIPELSIMETPGKMFTMKEAEIRLEEAVKAMVGSMAEHQVADIDFIERLEMNTIKGFSTMGKIISLKAQIRPGLDLREG